MVMRWMNAPQDALSIARPNALMVFWTNWNQINRALWRNFARSRGRLPYHPVVPFLDLLAPWYCLNT